jgi:hypothetical protein
MIMSQELSPLTLADCKTLDPIEPSILERMRGLSQAVKNANDVMSDPGYSIGLESLWNANASHPYGAIGSLSASASATGTQLGALPGITYTTNTTGITGPTYTIGSGGPAYTLGPGSINQGNVSIANTQFENSGKMVMKGEKADIEINGKSMTAWMEKVEQRLNILYPNPDMEKDWDDLRRLGERYKKLEKKCQEKSKMWEALKKMPPPKL